MELGRAVLRHAEWIAAVQLDKPKEDNREDSEGKAIPARVLHPKCKGKSKLKQRNCGLTACIDRTFSEACFVANRRSVWALDRLMLRRSRYVFKHAKRSRLSLTRQLHPIFASIDWAALKTQQVTPPIKPNVVRAMIVPVKGCDFCRQSDKLDVSNFDSEFTNQVRSPFSIFSSFHLCSFQGCCGHACGGHAEPERTRHLSRLFIWFGSCVLSQLGSDNVFSGAVRH